METSWLIERLDNPALLQKGDEQRLRELIATYPYFSAPYLLLARSLHDQKHPAFEQLLPLISLQAFDRKRLFRLIHEEEPGAVPAAGAGERESGVEVELTDEFGGAGERESGVEVELTDEFGGAGERESGVEVQESDIVRHAERSRSTTDKTEAIENEDETPIDRRAGVRFSVDFAEVEKSEETESTLHEELQEIPFLLTMDHGPLTMEEESDIVRHAERSRSTTDLPETSDEETRGLGDLETGGRGDLEMRGLGDEETGGRGDLETRGLGDEENESPNHKSQITNHKSPDRIDFLHWLEKLQPVKKGEETGGRGDEENEIDRHPEQANDLLKIEESPRRVEGPKPQTQNPDPETLINKFIETNPSVSRVKERFYDPAVQARESERLDDNLMTETLARIFVKQEKYERAIDAYRKLQLKYPEKSDYFAALILEINSKIN